MYQLCFRGTGLPVGLPMSTQRFEYGQHLNISLALMNICSLFMQTTIQQSHPLGL